MTSIFHFYARDDDKAFVRRLRADLTRAGFDVWFDRVCMPSRQLTFNQETRDAIAVHGRLLLVVGPGVLASNRGPGDNGHAVDRTFRRYTV